MRTVSNQDVIGMVKKSKECITMKKRLVAHGDVHGELDKFQENLVQAGLVDEDDRDRWIGGESILVQVGDVIDRGPKSREAYHFLKKLQIQARSVGGEVVMLAGNHELLLLDGITFYANFRAPFRLAEEMRQDIQKGTVQAAYVFGNRLFVHGGLRTKIREILKDEIRQKHGVHRDAISIELLADHINDLFKAAVRDADFSHAIFQADASRGGHADVAGVFWNDYRDLVLSEGADEIFQVVGHTPEGKKGAKGQYTDSLGCINIDAGLYEGYGGNQAFLVIEGNRIEIVYKGGRDWKTDMIGSFVNCCGRA